MAALVERPMAFDGQLSREMRDLFVGTEVFDLEIERQHGSEVARRRIVEKGCCHRVISKAQRDPHVGSLLVVLPGLRESSSRDSQRRSTNRRQLAPVRFEKASGHVRLLVTRQAASDISEEPHRISALIVKVDRHPNASKNSPPIDAPAVIAS